jgi:hypothetical protein
MTTSGSVNFSVSRDDIITKALQLCKVVGEGGSGTANQVTDAAVFLNALVKHLSTYGLQLWVHNSIIIFPVKNQAKYALGTSGNRACLVSEFIGTQLNGDHAAGDTTITVDSTTDMAASDKIGIVTDSGGIEWTTINGAPTSTVITLTTGLVAAAGDNNRVYTYTNAFTQRPLRFRSGFMRDESSNDTPVTFISHDEYTKISNKTTVGLTNQAYYDPQMDTGQLYWWPVPDDSYTNNILYANIQRVFEDFDAAGDTPDFPQEWYLTIIYKLAEIIAPMYGVTGQELNEISRMANFYFSEVYDGDTEITSIYLQPKYR